MIQKPSECCDGGTYEHCIPMSVHREVVWIDFCVAHLVATLEAGGLRPIASCCGHGKMPPSVLLEDRTNIVMLTDEQAEETMKRYKAETQHKP